MTTARPRRTPLHDRHEALGATLTTLDGWDLPVAYSGLDDEHLAVRTRAGVFDLCHLGEIEVAGRDALAGLQRITCNDASTLAIGRSQYSAILTPDGTIVDDVLVMRLAEEHFLVVTNAANTGRVYNHVAEHAEPAGDVVAVDSSARYALLAVQGPRALDVLQPLTGAELGLLPRFAGVTGEVAGARATISRTGYTGEDGFEIFVPARQVERVWAALLDAGRPVTLVPAGLAAADTLRLEAGLRRYGQDIDDTTTALEAGLSHIVSWTKGAFIGRDALIRENDAGSRRHLVGFEASGGTHPGVPAGADVRAGTIGIGHVTSAAFTPFLKKLVGMAYVDPDHAVPGNAIALAGADEAPPTPASIVDVPFYRRV